MGLIKSKHTITERKPVVFSKQDQQLVQALQNGLPVCHRPYLEIAQQMGCSEEAVLSRLQKLIDCGLIKRYGVVVRHRELGYRDNGMVVWDIPDADVSALGQRIAEFPCITLSYRRPRHLPHWPYNLFTMVHGHNRDQVKEKVEEIVQQCGLLHIPHQILFSTRRFKQRGASYSRDKGSCLKLVKP